MKDKMSEALRRQLDEDFKPLIDSLEADRFKIKVSTDFKCEVLDDANIPEKN